MFSFLMHLIEKDHNTKLATFPDALWWGVVCGGGMWGWYVVGVGGEWYVGVVVWCGILELVYRICT